MSFMVAVGIMTLMMAVMTGCSSGQETEQANAGLSAENEADAEAEWQNWSGEAEGYFDGEEFVAEKVIIEVYE